MHIYIERTKQKLTKTFSGVVSALLKELHLSSEEVLIVRNGTLITEDEVLEDTDEIKLLSVVSGG